MPRAVSDLLNEIKSVEPLPQVSMRVLELASHEDVVPRELVQIIQTDAGVTAKVLKLCNSAYYGFRREIATLQEAGNMLGVATLVNLVLTSCAGRYFRNYGSSNAEASLKLWESSMANAVATSLLARRRGVDRNRAYTVGLLENIGQLVLQRFLREDAHLIDAEVERGTPLAVAESMVFGIDHAEIGARLADKWSFPDLLIDAIRHHHAPEQSASDPTMAALGHLGEMATQRLEMAWTPHGPYAMSPRALSMCGLTEASFAELDEPLRAELEKAKGILEMA
jgi:HD-like signal output (HDOD) protein